MHLALWLFVKKKYFYSAITVRYLLHVDETKIHAQDRLLWVWDKNLETIFLMKLFFGEQPFTISYQPTSMYWIVSEENWRSEPLYPRFIVLCWWYQWQRDDEECVYSHNLMQLFLLFSTSLPEDNFPAL